MKRVFACGRLIYSLGNGVIPTRPIHSPILTITPPIIRSSYSNAGLSKKEIIGQVMQAMPAENYFTKSEIDKLYNLSVECNTSFLSQQQLITKINNLRGGDFVDVMAGLSIIGAIIILVNNANGFQPNSHISNVPPHLQWLYKNNYKPGQFGYGKNAGARIITVTKMSQNAGSDKKDPSSGSWDYVNIMKELARQSKNTKIEIPVGDQTYMFKNPYRQNADELQYKLAEKMYDSIRECDTDVCDIAESLGFKASNIKNLKDHVFYNQHYLDRYDGIEHRRFDATLEQALAWKRIETGTHTQHDITWIKHECAERHHELKYDSGYSEAHDRAQTRFDGDPWEKEF